MRTVRSSGPCRLVVCSLFVVCWGLGDTFANQEVNAPRGIVGGTIHVTRTKVKTVGPKSFKDVVVYLETVADHPFPASTKPAIVDQKGLVFSPHVLAVQRGTPVDFRNSDNDRHNVYLVDDKSGETKDLGTWQPGESRQHTFEKHHKMIKQTGKNGQPDTMIVLCKLHLEMAAYVVLLDNPFFTATSIEGDTQKAEFSIQNVPPGTYKLNIWHKTLKLKGGVQTIEIREGQATNVDLEITKAKYARKK